VTESCVMGKNKLGGNRAKRAANGPQQRQSQLTFKGHEQEYGQVLRMLGNGRCEVSCFDGVKRLCQICGKMRKRVWVCQGDLVLVSLRDFQDEKGDIILKYTADDARNLQAYGEIPGNIKINDTDLVDHDDDSFVQFTDELFSKSDGVPLSMTYVSSITTPAVSAMPL